VSGAAIAQQFIVTHVALRPILLYPTSCAAECNWSLWGPVPTVARNRLGLKRAKKLLMFQFNSHAHDAGVDDLFIFVALCG
jgi:hypothetical protein